MKKLSIVALIISLFVIGTISVKALNESELKEKIFQTVEIGGEKYSLSNEYKKMAETYLEQNEISDKDATYIGERIDKAISIAKEQGNVNFSNYPQYTKDVLKGLVAEISTNTSVKASLTKEGLIIKNADGSEYIITGLVKQTGYEVSTTAIIVAISFLIVAVGTGFVIKQVKTSE